MPVRRLDAMRRFASAARSTAVCVMATIAISCHALPQEIPLYMATGAKPPNARNIADYHEAIGAIVWVMVNKFALPIPRGTLEVYSTREDFEQGLVKHLKIAPDLARSTAEFAKSAVGGHIVLVNAPAVADSDWPQRIELLAHELTHCVQLTLAKRSGISRPQWLIEGFAEWMAYNVTDALALDDLRKVRAQKRDKVRELRRKGEIPRLLEIESFGDWVAARKRYGFDGTYSLSFLVTDFLVARHSLSAVADYFRRYESSDDSSGHFRAAFGEELGEFEQALQPHLDSLLK